MHDAKSLKQHHHLTSPKLSKPETVHRCTCPTSSTCRCTTFATCDLAPPVRMGLPPNRFKPLASAVSMGSAPLLEPLGGSASASRLSSWQCFFRCGLAAFRSSLVLLEHPMRATFPKCDSCSSTRRCPRRRRHCLWKALRGPLLHIRTRLSSRLRYGHRVLWDARSTGLCRVGHIGGGRRGVRRCPRSANVGVAAAHRPETANMRLSRA